MLTLFCKHSDVIRILERELAETKSRYDHERQRAEAAIDELLRVRTEGVAGPVAPPPPPSAAERRIQELLKDPEFTGAGDAE